MEIGGIDDEQSDDLVYVTVLHSKDPMAKSADGSRILADYSFRLTDDPEYNHYVTRFKGRIVAGVVTTEPVDQFRMVHGEAELNLYRAGMRLKFMEDGSLKGVLGGYQDWRRLMALNANSNLESLYGFQSPSIFNALKRYADGLRYPVTGECNGISSAYDIEGAPAFVSEGPGEIRCPPRLLARAHGAFVPEHASFIGSPPGPRSAGGSAAPSAQDRDDGYAYSPSSHFGTGKTFMGRPIANVVDINGAEWFDRSERAEEEGSEKVIPMLGLKPTDVVADLGAGTGYFSFHVEQGCPARHRLCRRYPASDAGQDRCPQSERRGAQA